MGIRAICQEELAQLRRDHEIEQTLPMRFSKLTFRFVNERPFYSVSMLNPCGQSIMLDAYELIRGELFNMQQAFNEVNKEL